MADLEITIQEVDDVRYNLLVTYYDKKYMKAVDASYLDTCIQILKLYPKILKDALINNLDNLDFFTFTEGKKKGMPVPSKVYQFDEELKMTVTEDQNNMSEENVAYQYDGELKMKFTIDLQFGKEVIEICLDQVGTVDLNKKNSDMIKQLQEKITTLEEMIDYVFSRFPKLKGSKNSPVELWSEAKKHFGKEPDVDTDEHENDTDE